MVQAENIQAPRAGIGADGLAGNRYARWCVYALVAFPVIDYGLRLPHIHPIGVIWDKVVLLILLVIAIRRFLAGQRPDWFIWQRYAGWYILFTFALMFADMGHPFLAIQGFRSDVYYMLFPFLLPFVVVPRDVIKLLHISVSIAILIAIHGVYQYITKAPIPAMWVDVNEHVRTRVFSVLQSPNELGSYMALMIPITLGLFMYETHRWRKWWYGIGMFFCAATLLFTFTRGAWIAFGLSILLMSIIFERRLLIVLLIFAVIGYFLPPIHHRIADLLSPVYWLKSAQAGRIARWLQAFDNMAQNPLFGVGLGRYGGQVAALYNFGIYSDNYYAKILGESGLVGLVIFLTIHISLMIEFYRKCVKLAKGKARYVALGGMTGLLAVIIHNSVENVFEFGPMVITYFILATLFLIWSRGFSEEEENDAPTLKN